MTARLENLKSLVDKLVAKNLDEEATMLAGIVNTWEPAKTVIKAEYLEAIQLLKSVEDDIAKLDNPDIKKLGARISITARQLKKLL